ncbi:MAG: AAA family ATPase [Parachlamydiales bacterium]|nr:AAA family ATPase [Verrucomicrobiota bacterium]MBX3719310.1 AAA family ATPase [Candidatus Acheromyda pituitae]
MVKGLFIASTGQHVGKTTTCLGLISGLKKRFAHVDYMKPIGQEHVEIKKGLSVDKDVLIFKEHFSLKASYEDMSPVLIPSGFTRQFLDKKIDEKELIGRIKDAVKALQKKNGFLLVEGTGHCGVGSIINLNNAQVASLLNFPMILIASGGLGSAYDELMLNKTLCEMHGVKVLGVILNRVLPEKKSMVGHYMPLALKRWNLPLIGSIPFDSFLSNPSMKDFESLFETRLVTGQEHQLRHSKHVRLVATSVETYQDWIVKSQLIITPANREDIILATLSKHWDTKIADPHDDLESAMILTGDHPPRHYIVEELQKAHIPMLYTPFHSHTAMKMISSFTAKIQTEDVEKVHEAIDVVEKHIDFDLLDLLLRQ